ncbi:Transporter, major facilitator family protein, partial [human gut metagenome]
MAHALGVGYIYLFLFILGGYMKRIIRKYGPPIFHCINDFGQGSLAALIPFFIAN